MCITKIQSSLWIFHKSCSEDFKSFLGAAIWPRGYGATWGAPVVYWSDHGCIFLPPPIAASWYSAPWKAADSGSKS